MEIIEKVWICHGCGDPIDYIVEKEMDLTERMIELWQAQEEHKCDKYYQDLS